jgi:hypothetical protein
MISPELPIRNPALRRLVTDCNVGPKNTLYMNYLPLAGMEQTRCTDLFVDNSEEKCYNCLSGADLFWSDKVDFASPVSSCLAEKFV